MKPIKVMMTSNAKGISQESGASTMTYMAGTEYEATEEWQIRVLTNFVKNHKANEISSGSAVTETKTEAKPKTTRKPRAKKAVTESKSEE